AFITINGGSEVEMQVVAGKFRARNVPVGTKFNFTIRLIDDCKNTEEYFFHDFHVDDVIPPVAICEKFRAVSMGLECEVEIPAEAFDDGSYDNCGQVTFTVARMDELNQAGFLFGQTSEQDFIFFDGDEALFRKSVKFTLADMDGCIGTHTVVFRVEDGHGNYNYCMVEVELQDKIPPVVRNRDIRLKCTEPLAAAITEAAAQGASAVQDLLNGGTFVDPAGVAYITAESDNCNNARFLVDLVRTGGFDVTCRQGEIVINFQAVDACGNVSLPGRATIKIWEFSDWAMRFPMDADILCEENVTIPAARTIDQILTNNGCDHWALNVSEKEFTGVEDACYKIVREYHLINWCTWNPSNTEVAVVERPEDLILDPLYTVALRYRDANNDGFNDINDGDENANGQYLYASLNDRVNTFQPIRIPFTSSQLRRIADNAEAAAWDPYDVTGETDDADYVVIDNNDTPYDVVRNPLGPSRFRGNHVSQFSGDLETYVSAQHYGNIVYRQIIKVQDIKAPIIVGQQTTAPFCGGDAQSVGGVCNAPVQIQFTATDLCAENVQVSYRLRPYGGRDIITDPFGALAKIGTNEWRITGNYPILEGGRLTRHFFIVRATDRCGNFSEIEIPFEVIDCKAPTPKCIFGLSIDLMANGKVTIPAVWFDKGSFDFCDDNLEFFYADPAVHPDSTSRTFDCNKGELGVVPVNLWVRDDAGNTAFCETFVNVQANPQGGLGAGADGCFTGSGASIAGAIETEANNMVENVSVSLSGNASGTSMTSTSGQYQFIGLEMGYDYSVTPILDEQPLNGVSTFDLVLISKHILGVQLLDSPYKLIAADVNNSGSITTFDMVTLRKVILNLEPNFPNNTSWRFIPKDYKFQNTANPFAENFPEVLNFNNITEEAFTANYYAVKVGDVNGSAIANSLMVEGRNFNGTAALTTNEATLAVGEEYTVSFTAAELAGYQFTMNFAGVELVKVIEGVAKAENFGVFANELTASWNGEASEEVAFSVVVRATAATTLSQAIKVTSSRTAAEAYDATGAVKAVAINFVSTGYELGQNRPNPFSGETLIQITLPAAQKATLTVADVTGKVLTVISGNFEAGYNEVRLNSKELAAGVLYYTLTTDNFTATRKMIIME
ncbi:MAG: T9SS type A sorting domain-containing protein, partial [Saprospiraceae bacterium]|nr:T9SS type A sorting domain-containing protein [Saprospiraceae bacterium]